MFLWKLCAKVKWRKFSIRRTVTQSVFLYNPMTLTLVGRFPRQKDADPKENSEFPHQPSPLTQNHFLTSAKLLRPQICPCVFELKVWDDQNWVRWLTGLPVSPQQSGIMRAWEKSTRKPKKRWVSLFTHLLIISSVLSSVDTALWGDPKHL